MKTFDWPGRLDQAGLVAAPPTRRIRPPLGDAQPGVGQLIVGDNLHALAALKATHGGRVKLVITDPPYATGRTNLVYADRRDSRFDWLNSLHPRLALARELLAPDGVCMIHINDDGHAAMRVLLDDVFGYQNHVATIVRDTRGRSNSNRLVSRSHEHIVIHARDKRAMRANADWRLPRPGAAEVLAEAGRLLAGHGPEAGQPLLREWFRNLPAGHPSRSLNMYAFLDERGAYRKDDMHSQRPGNLAHPITHPRTGRAVPPPQRGYYNSAATIDRLIGEGRVHFGPDETHPVRKKTYLHETTTAISGSIVESSQKEATNRLNRILGGMLFTYPKCEQLTATLIRMATRDGDIILDPWAGSGTVGHAAAIAGSIDGARRHTILVQLDEPTPPGSLANARGHHLVSDITRERLRLAGTPHSEHRLEEIEA